MEATIGINIQIFLNIRIPTHKKNDRLHFPKTKK